MRPLSQEGEVGVLLVGLPSREGLWAAGEWDGVRRVTFEGSSPFFPGSGTPESGNVDDLDGPLTFCNSRFCQKVSEVGIPH